MKKRIITIIFFNILIFNILAQTMQPKFIRVSISDGLSLSSVYCGIQDSKGFLWFGTEDGLNRYDGKNFTIFRPEINDTNSISEKWVEAIYEDKTNFLWIITKIGINKFNPKTEIFKKYLSQNRSSNNNLISCFYQDIQTDIWVGSQKGAFKYDKQKDDFKEIFPEVLHEKNINCFLQKDLNNLFIGTSTGLYMYSKNENKIIEIKLPVNSQNVNCLYLDKNKNIWLGTEGFLLKYTDNQNFIKFAINNFSIIETVFQDSQNRFWIGTTDGFYKFSEKKAEFEKIIDAPETSGSSSINNKKPIFEDKEWNIWFGTYGKGVYKYSIITNSLTNYVSNATDKNSLSENAINLIFQDKSGCIWFGTFGAGLNKYDPIGTKFPLIKHNPFDNNSLAEDFIWSIYETSSGDLWIGTNASGVDKYSPKTGIFTHYQNQVGNSNSLSNNCVREIYEDKNGNMWFGTNGGGLNKLDIKTNKFTNYKNIANDSTSISNNSVRVVYQDNNEIFWIGTADGFNKFDEKTSKFKSFKNDINNPNSISSNFIYTVIFQNDDSKIWIGTYTTGISIFDPKTETFENYSNSETDTTTIIAGIINGIIKENSKTFWIATSNGLEKFDYEQKIFYHYNIKNGLPNNTIYGCLPDMNGNIWLSTNYGVSQFNIQTNTFKNFDTNDGLQSNEFNGGASFLGKSGKLYFAGVYGLNAFFADSIKYNYYSAPVVITNLLIFNSKINILNSKTIFNEKNNNEIILDNGNYYINKSISYTDTIKLSYREKVFSFEFAALHYSNPAKNKYKYRLLNFEKNWNEISNRNYVTYTNIDAGTYVFEITAANSDGVWSNQITRLTIIITPPFYQTWLFRISFVFLIIFGIVFTYKKRVNIIKKQNARLEIIVKERTSEILQKNIILNNQNEEIKTQANNLQNANIEITLQKELIEKTHKNITDSILYAKRIQTAILPESNFMTLILPQHFIFFKPRDVVSGDFYFLKQIKNYNYIAAADCTGHGVPGAFMSMLGIGLLNEIISNKEITNANLILNELRKQIKNSLQQTGQIGEQQDGMDIAFCVLNTQTFELSFSGAHNSLFLIKNIESDNKNIEKTLLIYDADKQPVGVFLKERPFTEHKIQLQTKDIFYIFTDGYHSQFGGDKNEKFKTSRFKNLIIEVSELHLEEQKIILEQKFKQWQATSEQTDDVLVIGIKI